MLNPVSQNLLNGYYPLPNVSGSGSSYNYETLQPIPSNTNGFDARLDQYITSNQQIYARFSWKNLLSDSGQLGLPANPLLPNDLNVEHDRSLIVSYNYTISPKMVNEFRFGFTNSLINSTFPIQGATADNQLGLTGISFANHPNSGAFPTFNFSDGTGFTPIGRDKDGPGESKTMQFTDNLSRTMGKHTLRFGIDARRVFYETVVRWGQSDDFGAFTFNQGVFTGSSFGDFLLGAPNTDFIVGSSPNTNEPSVQWGIYAQDQWQVNRSAHRERRVEMGGASRIHRKPRRHRKLRSAERRRRGSEHSLEQNRALQSTPSSELQRFSGLFQCMPVAHQKHVAPLL